MKKQLLTSALFIFCLSVCGYGQTSIITGYVFNDKDKPEAGIVVVVNGSPGITLEDGKFTIDFKSSTLQPGTPITISVEKQAWSVLTPFMGEEQIQNKEFNNNPFRILIAPKGSPRFLEPDKMSELTAAIQIAVNTRQLEKNPKGESDAASERVKEEVLEDYARWSGFKAEAIRSALNDWARNTRALGNKDEALKAYARKEFSKSGDLLLEAARDKAAIGSKRKQEAQNADKETIDTYMRSGFVYSEGSELKRALDSFDELEQKFETGEFSKESYKYEWLGLKGMIGRTKVRLSYQAKQDEAMTLLKAGIASFTQALESTTREQFLDRWTALQFDLGITLLSLREWSKRDQRGSILQLAIRAFNEADISSQQLSKTDNPRFNPSTSQISLGNIWTTLGEKTKGQESIDYLERALNTFDKADKVIKRDQMLIAWAGLRTNQGRAYSDLADRASNPAKSEEYLNKSVAALKEADDAYASLLDSTRLMCSPCAGSMLLDLGAGQTMLGERASDPAKSEEYFNRALDAFDKAGKLFPSENPVTWANLRAKQGQVYSDLAEATSAPAKSEEYLKKAVSAYEEAYAFGKQNPCSDCAGFILVRLGEVQTRLGERVSDYAKGREYLNKALETFNLAAKTIEQDDEPLDWADLKSGQGQAYSDLADMTNDPARSEEYLNKAVAALEEAYTLGKGSPCSPCIVSTLIGLGMTRIQLGEHVKDSAKSQDYYNKALDTFEQAGKITKHDDVFRWATLRTNQGRAYSDLADMTSDPARSEEYLNKAVAALEEAYAFGKGSPCSPCIASTLNRLGSVQTRLGEHVNDSVKSREYFNKALETLDKAGKLIRSDDLDGLATLRSNQGQAYSDLAEMRNDPAKGEQYLNKAVSLYEEAYTFGKESPCSSCIAATLMGLGLARTQSGEQTSDPAKSEEYFNRALDAFDKAGKLFRSDELSALADLRANQGRAYSGLANRTNDSTKKTDYLNKAVAALEEAYTFGKQNPCSSCIASALIDLGIAQLRAGEGSNDAAKGEEYFNKALDHLDQADKLIEPHNRLKRANLRTNQGWAYSDLAEATSAPAKSEEYLKKAVSAYEEAYTFGKQSTCSSCIASTLIDLGIAQLKAGERNSDPAKSQDYYNQALDSLDQADKLTQRDKEQLNWADLRSNQGRAYSDLAFLTNDSTKKTDYLNKAVAAYKDADKIYSPEHDPQGWSDTRVGLANAYLSLKSWTDAIEVSNSVLQVFQDNYRAYVIKSGALHDGLFEFKEAFALNKEWLDQHHYDLNAQFDFAEKNFTTERFPEAIRLINTLLINPDTPVDVIVALQAIEIGCLLATNRAQEVPAKLETLIDVASKQSSNFRVGWIFDGSRRFIAQSEKLLSQRAWMEALLNALDPQLDHDAMLKALKEVKANFKH